ncbi:MAG TPA: PEGA domain-containing protein, partial [Terriglobales bacterium]|nr:PEGA domain-containing protein [Terriglobales bacterium]
PSEQNPILRFTFGKLREQSSNGHERAYASDVVVENLWSKPIASAEFSVYLFDKNNTRIGEGYIQFTNARAGETIKFQANFFASGAPASLTLVGRRLPGELQSLAPAQMVSLTVNSIPQGAELKIDGKPWGTTPKLVEVSTGDHLLEFTLQGFSTGHFPLVVRPNDISGGSVTFELGTAAHDTVELRDGTVITGDVQSMNATEVRVTVGGANQTIDRNKVKRILLVERTSPQ